jgi:hypothetical protein
MIFVGTRNCQLMRDGCCYDNVLICSVWLACFQCLPLWISLLGLFCESLLGDVSHFIAVLDVISSFLVRFNNRIHWLNELSSWPILIK